MKATPKQRSWIENRIKELRRQDEKVMKVFPDQMEAGVNKTFIHLDEKIATIPMESAGLIIGLLKDEKYYMRAIKLLIKFIK